jgi:UDP-glucuronate 4-epimerase
MQSSSNREILVTGAAGFIGMHVAARLLDEGHRVVGFDNLNPYYDPALKRARLAVLEGRPGWRFVAGDLANAAAISALFASTRPVHVVHLAAQAGVRWSLENPSAYVQSNLVGFGNVLEACRHGQVAHLLYASSSSVYGANTKVPFAVTDNTDHPVSLYAATKKANEAMAHSYAHLFGLPCTGLRFFTVYGPWGRPDMAYWKFTEAILDSRPIEVFGDGQLERDFTYVDDVVEAVVRLVDRPATPDPAWRADAPDPATSSAPWRLYNIGNHTPVKVATLVDLLEQLCGRPAQRVFKPKPPGDVDATFADVTALAKAVDFRPATPLAEGLARFVAWFRDWRETDSMDSRGFPA